MSTEQFRRPFFSAIGSVEWKEFARAAHDWAKKEDALYPNDQSHCLLCERPLDDVSRKHVDELLAFVEGDAQRASKLAEHFRIGEIAEVERRDCGVLAPDSRTRSHIHRLDPALETQVDEFVKSVEGTKSATIAALTERNAVAQSAEWYDPISMRGVSQTCQDSDTLVIVAPTTGYGSMPLRNPSADFR